MKIEVSTLVSHEGSTASAFRESPQISRCRPSSPNIPETGHGRVLIGQGGTSSSASAGRLESSLWRRPGECHLTEAQRRAYVIADNKLAQNAGWDRDVLAIELQALIDVEFDIELTGFSLAEVGTLSIPRSFAASTRPWPATISFSSLTRTGLAERSADASGDLLDLLLGVGASVFGVRAQVPDAHGLDGHVRHAFNPDFRWSLASRSSVATVRGAELKAPRSLTAGALVCSRPTKAPGGWKPRAQIVRLPVCR